VLFRSPGGVGGTDAQIRMARLPSAEMPGDDSSDEAEGRVLFRPLLELIRAEFEERTWQAFWLTTIEDRTPKEVAIDLKMTPGAVRVAKSRVLQRFREELGEIG